MLKMSSNEETLDTEQDKEQQVNFLTSLWKSLVSSKKKQKAVQELKFRYGSEACKIFIKKQHVWKLEHKGKN